MTIHANSQYKVSNTYVFSSQPQVHICWALSLKYLYPQLTRRPKRLELLVGLHVLSLTCHCSICKPPWASSVALSRTTRRSKYCWCSINAHCISTSDTGCRRCCWPQIARPHQPRPPGNGLWCGSTSRKLPGVPAFRPLAHPAL